MRIAFKEWAVMVEALGRGKQILILRKGGIAEGRGGFQVEHRRFLLFPTQFHQQRDQATADGQRLYDELPAPAPDRVRLEYVADVVGWQKVESLEQALGLRGLHCWREEVIRDRFDWGREAGIFALALRVARLPQAAELPMLPAYGGCRSWVELAADLTTDNASPVLSDEEFASRVMELEVALNGKLIPNAKGDRSEFRL